MLTHKRNTMKLLLNEILGINAKVQKNKNFINPDFVFVMSVL